MTFGSRTPTPDELLRSQQIEDARRMQESEEDAQPAARRTLHIVKPHERATRPVAARSATTQNRVPLKGHEAFLKALEMAGADVVLEKLSTGLIYFGKVKHSDKFTITMRVLGTKEPGEPRTDCSATERVVFKHDISEFYTTSAPKAPPAPLPLADVNTEEGHAV